VRDTRATARYEGGLRARQGTQVLTTPVLTASYSGRLGLMNQSRKSGAKRRKQAPMKLRLIRAMKPVRVISGEDMQADGEQAEFDMLANTVTISGNVVLRQGRQIVRGDRLIIDLKTGLSRMKNAGPDRNQRKPLTFGAAPQITANPGRRDCGGQMCAVFFPADVQKKQLKKAPTVSSDRSRNSPRLDSGWTTRSTN